MSGFNCQIVLKLLKWTKKKSILFLRLSCISKCLYHCSDCYRLSVCLLLQCSSFTQSQVATMCLTKWFPVCGSRIPSIGHDTSRLVWEKLPSGLRHHKVSVASTDSRSYQITFLLLPFPTAVFWCSLCCGTWQAALSLTRGKAWQTSKRHQWAHRSGGLLSTAEWPIDPLYGGVYSRWRVRGSERH